MKAKKILAMLLSVIMIFALAGCGDEPAVVDESTETPVAEDAAVEEVVAKEASINFEDGLFGFMGVDTSKGNSDESTLSVEDYSGSKALKVTVAGKVPYIVMDVEALLGEKMAEVATIEMDMGVVSTDGVFAACSGNVIVYSGADNAETKYPWSVYLADKNPKSAVVTLSAAMVAASGNYVVITKEVDTGVTPSDLYIDNIRFLDASGNLIVADSSAVYAPVSTEVDMTNLKYLKNVVDFTGFACAGDGWGQNGFDMPQEIIDALVPGAVIQIEYASESGDMWIVMPDSAAGWMRVAQQAATKNGSGNIAQITYEEIAAVCGEDATTWGARLQAESDTAWEVFAVKVGQDSGVVTLENKVDFAGFEVAGTAWGQNGLDIPQEILDALVPGSVIELEYSSTMNNLWIVMPDSAAGWMRVQQQTAACTDSICQITYEQIAEVCGEDKTTWGARLQVESEGDWEVYSVKVGTPSRIVALKDKVEFAGFALAGDAWGQNGLEMTQEVIDALVPGSVIELEYASESGLLWVVLPDAAAGWMRVQQQTAACNGTKCQITYEEIAALCGEDKTTWGARLQVESDTAWEVYSVFVGTPK